MKSFFTAKRTVFILLCALVLSGIAVTLAYETFALGADDGLTDISVPEGADADVLASLLKDGGLIKSKAWFKIYAAMRGSELDRVSAGVYSVPSASGYDGILAILSGRSENKRRQVRIVIPEGCTVRGIARRVSEVYGISSEKELLSEAINGDFSEFEFLPRTAGATEGVDPTSRLEGYLYPDTYYVYSDSSAHEIITVMLENFARKVDGRYLAACERVGMTLGEAVTLASVIVREGASVSEYGRISSVFHNRLASRTFGGRLQSDATLVYVLGREMSASDKSLDSPYNTYSHGGLPPTPICCPDVDAIAYALYPDKTDYFYFVTGKCGTLFASDYHTHQENVRRSKG